MIIYHTDQNQLFEYELVKRDQKNRRTEIWGYNSYETAYNHKKALRKQFNEIDYPNVILTIERVKDFERHSKEEI